MPLKQLYAGQTMANKDFAENLSCEVVDAKIDMFETEMKELRISIRQEVEEEQEDEE